MISDPKTTPIRDRAECLSPFSSPPARLTSSPPFYRNNGLLWSLAVCSLLTPLIDRVSPGKKYRWQHPNSSVRIEARQLADLTGWNLNEIRTQMDFGSKTGGIEERRWEKISRQ